MGVVMVEQGQKELNRAALILNWNKKIMSTLGLWPSSRNNIKFSINFGYFSFLMILEYMDLVVFINDLEHVIMNLTENMAFSQIFVRMIMLWIYNDEIGDVINETIKDFDHRRYKTIEERQLFITYNAKSKLFVKLLITFVALTASSYYLTPIMVSMGNGLPQIEVGNVSETLYLLPYRFYTFRPLQDLRSYTIIYVLELPFVFISGFGQSAADCIMVTLVFHICGQMSVLALRINNIEIDPKVNRKEIQKVVESHARLLRMGKVVANAFSVTLLAHLFGATSLVCILGYQILTNYSNGEKAVLISFLVFQFLVLLILYAHCTVGECLLSESTKVCDAFYACRWYDMPINNARSIILCIARSQKPMCLTAGKFSTFCLSTLTDVLRTSMGYLSVLRSFL
ncbi:odorant receptor 13a-like isoform X1 [Vespa velutina]|uniref:odorant receptor 13a-like isoform X1 n=1 Tax=Vespa velutina TaxID=202808 RepID=UPI001FB50493|nr:odorant receptor 13a-like isoform X1 [Vespa velutina]